MIESGKSITELSAERAVPETMSGRLMESEHRGRYLWAAQLAQGREVIDAGCGTGYGTEILAAAGAQRVIGVDLSQDAIDVARSSPNGSMAEYMVGDVTNLPFADDTFDLAVCLEVIEHVDDQPLVIRELRRILRPAGVLVISSPNRDVYPPGNPNHTHEYVPEELERALLLEFANQRLYRQSPWLGAAVFDDEQSRVVGVESEMLLRNIKIAAVNPGEEVFSIGVASNSELPSPDPLFVMGEPFEVRWWEEQLRSMTSERDGERKEHEREREEHENERRERDRIFLAVETDLANARDQIEQLTATQADIKSWAARRIRQLATRARDCERDSRDADAARRDADAARRDADAARRDADAARRDAEQARCDFENRLLRAENTIDDITGSLSWRITAPMRGVKRLLSSKPIGAE